MNLLATRVNSDLRWLPVLAILGPPGAGKTTQSQLLAEAHSATAISIGDLLRQHRRLRNPATSGDGDIDRGEFMSDESTMTILKNHLEGIHGAIILDGFPRTANQAQMMAKTDSRLSTSRIIVLDVSEDTVLDRLLARAAIQNRADDEPVAIRRRLQLYEDHIESVLNGCAAAGHQIFHLPGVGSPSKVAQAIAAIVREPSNKSDG